MLYGRAGNDLLAGGDGQDNYYFARNYDRDTITDFANNVDELFISTDLGVANAARVMAKGNQVGADVVFDFAQGDVLVVRNIKLAVLQDDIVIF